MIKFKSVRWQNFLSTGNQWTEIQLDKANSTLVVGENGAGKSTMLDAILFALYGKPYRNINKPLLVNSITNKGCLVEIEFKTKNRNFLVRRGLKPAVFEIYCDGKLIDQNASVKEYQDHLEKYILKLNQKSFTQIIVIGSANFTPFMQLKPQERREVIEDLLDIQIFSVMFNQLKERIAENKNAIVDSKHNIEMLDQKIEMSKKHMNEIRSIKNSDRKAKEEKIISLEQSKIEIQDRLEIVNQSIQDKTKLIANQDSIKKKLKKLKEFEYQFNYKIKNLDEEIGFFEHNDECPTCSQSIDEQFKSTKIDSKTEKKLEVQQALVDLAKHFDEVNTQLEEISNIQTLIFNLQQEMLKLNTESNSIVSNIDSLTKELSVKVEDDSDSLLKIQEYKKQCDEQREKHQAALQRKDVYDIASSLLKDGGIKAKIIKQYVPVINKLVNKYLAAMEFFVQFELDENFNEKIKSRFRDEFTYESFSEGEKMRIDLSLLFTWRAVAKLRNSISTNLLIMDEVFDSSLDNTGTDEFLKIITQLNKDTNVFVISHKGDQLFDKFQNLIRFEKTKNFSKIAA